LIDEVAAKLLFLPKNLLENYNLREILRDYLDPVFSILNYRIFTLGDAQITPLNIIYLIVLTVLLFWNSIVFL